MKKRISIFARRSFLITAVLSSLACTNHTTPFIRPGQTHGCQGAENTPLVNRLILVGDTGRPEHRGRQPVFEGMSKYRGDDASKTTVLFLGDLIYDGTINSKDETVRQRSRERLLDQYSFVATNGLSGIFIPGNHDWDGGRGSICAQAALVQEFRDSNPEHSRANIHYFPQPCGCPGPAFVDFPAFQLAVLDTTWLRREKRRQKTSMHCPNQSISSTLQALKDGVKSEKPLIIAGHHGVRSYGPHGQFYDWKDHVFPLRQGGWTKVLWIPLPGIGTLVPLFHSTIGCALDACGPLESHIQRQLRETLESINPVVYAAGHDHSLQVLTGEPFAQLLLISGAGSPTAVNEVTSGTKTLFAQSTSGFMVVDFLESKKIIVRVITTDEAGTREAYTYCTTSIEQ